jgi:hypothetical protein
MYTAPHLEQTNTVGSYLAAASRVLGVVMGFLLFADAIPMSNGAALGSVSPEQVLNLTAVDA